MTLGIISGFAALALASGFFLLKKSSVSSGSGSSSSGAVSSDKIDDYITNAANGSYYVPIGQLTNSSITSAPFSLDNPDFTGATYYGDDWFLMANGQYFNRKSKQWSSEPPKKGSGSVVGGVGSGAVAGSVVSGATDAVVDTVKAKNRILILVCGVIATIAISRFKKN